MPTHDEMRKKTLAEELAELVNPAPRKEIDPDSLNYCEDAPRGFDDEDLFPDGAMGAAPTRKAQERQFRYQPDILLEDATYRGKRISRAELFENGIESEDGGGSTEEDEGEEEEDVGSEEGSEGDDGRAAEIGRMMDDEGQEPSSSSAGEEDEDEEGEEGSSDEYEWRDDKNSRGDDSAGAIRDAGGAEVNGEPSGQRALPNGSLLQDMRDSDFEEEADTRPGPFLREDPETEQLEQQLAMLQEEDQEVLRNMRQHSSKEMSKAASVANQQLLWDRHLEIRILLQRALAMSNRLPRPVIYPLVITHSPDCSSQYQQMSGNLRGLLGNLLELHSALAARQTPLAKAMEDVTEKGNKRSREEAGLDDLWSEVESHHRVLAPFRDAALDKWHRRTVLSSGAGALRNQLRALNQSITTQVAAVMRDPGKFIKRTQLLRALCPRVLCGGPAEPEAMTGETEGEEKGHGVSSLEEDRDPETFDDGEFYQQLLKEFLEASKAGNEVQAKVVKAEKRRKVVDRKASKGRKIRYNVHEKLVNFTTPEHAELPVFAPQLFANLFGHDGT